MKIVYLCHFSNALIRSRLHLKTYKLRSFLLSLAGKSSSISYNDFAIWNSDMAEEFKKINNHEFHLISPHNGMIRNTEHFKEKGVNYHFYKCNGSLLTDIIRSTFKLDRRNNYRRFRFKIKKIIHRIKPDVVVVCGADQPYFSSGIFDIDSLPVYVLLQTVINNPEVKKYYKNGNEMGRIEEKVFRQTNYVGTNEKYLKLFRQYNSFAYCLPYYFPSHQPPIIKDTQKKFDFVFYASIIQKNKGIEDVIKAYNIVYSKHPQVSLNICGNVNPEYKKYLESLIAQEALVNGRVVFTGFFPNLDEKYKHIQKSKIVVIPGISSALNSTVRESLLMGLPTIVYETSEIVKINKNIQVVVTARMEDVDDLADKMDYMLMNPKYAEDVAREGKKYADKIWDNSIVVSNFLTNVEAIVNHYYNNQPIPKELLMDIE